MQQHRRLGTRTADGHLYQTRNLDWNLEVKAHEVPVIIVYVPENGIPHVVPSFAGSIGAHTGFNARGVVLSEMGDASQGDALRRARASFHDVVPDDALRRRVADAGAGDLQGAAADQEVPLRVRRRRAGEAEKVDKFDYSLGPIDRLRERYGCDGLLFVYGYDEISSGGRKALMATGAIVGALTGVVVMPRGGVTTIDVALGDAPGSILWYSFQAQGGSDLRDPRSAAQLVERVMSDFPECRR